MTVRERTFTKAQLPACWRARFGAGPFEAIGRAADIRRAATLKRNDTQSSSFYKKWDDDDKRSAGFRNYQLGYTTLRDIENPTDHVTLWDEHAHPLVQAFADRFAEVPSGDLIRGKDF